MGMSFILDIFFIVLALYLGGMIERYEQNKHVVVNTKYPIKLIMTYDKKEIQCHCKE